MSEFKITAVSQKPPKAWSGKFGAMETYTIKLSGDDDPIEINRKPGNVPRVGDVLNGTLESTEFGKKFKVDPNARPTSGGYHGKSPEEQSAIQRMNALTNAVSYFPQLATSSGDVLEIAELFYEWLKGTTVAKPKPPVAYDNDNYDDGKGAPPADENGIPF